MSKVGRNVQIDVSDHWLILDLTKLGEHFKLVDFCKDTPIAAQRKF